VTTAQTSIHVEEVGERFRRPRPTPPGQPELPDLTPVRVDCLPPPPGGGNRPVGVRVAVRNLGPGAAPESTLHVLFQGPGAGTPGTAPIQALAAGEADEADVPIPRTCPALCSLEAIADGANQVVEADEDNNTVAGACTPLPG
jgi:hypothetical protein